MTLTNGFLELLPICNYLLQNLEIIIPNFIIADCGMQIADYRSEKQCLYYFTICNPKSEIDLDHPFNFSELLLQPLFGYRHGSFKLLGKNRNFVFLNHPEKFLDRPSLFIRGIG